MDDIMSDPKTIPHIKDTEIEFDELLDVVRPPGLCNADEQFLKKGGLSDLPAATSVDNTLSRERAIFYSTHPYSEFRKSFEKRRMDHTPKTSILRQYLQKLQDTLGSRLPRDEPGIAFGAVAHSVRLQHQSAQRRLKQGAQHIGGDAGEQPEHRDRRVMQRLHMDGLWCRARAQQVVTQVDGESKPAQRREIG